ncbi:hypothetical protein CR513_12190, partial [Mucuna pruriens]
MMQNLSQFRKLLTKDPLTHLKKFLHFVNMIECSSGSHPFQIEPSLLGTSAHISSCSRTLRRRLGEIQGDTSQLIHIYYNNLSTLNQTSINATCGGTTKYFTPSKSNKLKKDIMNFSQFE